MLKTSRWRTVPEPVLLNCSEVHELGQDEFVVQFKTKNGNYTSFVPREHVDADSCQMHAFIVADVDEGVYVLIPAETLISGPRILVEDSEKGELLTSSNWVTGNGVE